MDIRIPYNMGRGAMAVDVLPEFQEFLKQKKIVPGKQILRLHAYVMI